MEESGRAGRGHHQCRCPKAGVAWGVRGTGEASVRGLEGGREGGGRWIRAGGGLSVPGFLKGWPDLVFVLEAEFWLL